MSYSRYYEGGWQSGESGGTPITPEALNHMEEGIMSSAPAGYGYGEPSANLGTFATESDLEAALTDIMAGLTTYVSKQVNFTLTPYSGYRYYATVYKRTVGNCLVDATSYSSAIRFVKVCSSGVWTPLEFVNPPMALGVEYRTTERHNGKAVYTMLINAGAMANTGTITCAIGDVTPELVIDLSGVAVNTSGTTNMFPIIDIHGNTQATMRKTGQRTIGITSFSDMSSYTAYVAVKYTKASS